MTASADILAIAARFETGAPVASVAPHHAGHINDSYLVTAHSPAAPVRFLLQRINRAVFRDPPRVMDNIARVTDHLRRALLRSAAPDPHRRALSLIPSRSGDTFARDRHGEYWRMYAMIEGAVASDSAAAPDQARHAARALGQFQRLLADYDGPRLHDTIPDFHHTPRRLAALDDAVAADPLGRAATVRTEIAFVQRHRRLASILTDLHAAGHIPERIVHNDAKISNVLFDAATGHALCVVDLDTVMPGLSLFDFGDMVRSMSSRRPEDETDLAAVRVRVPFFEAIARGYLDAAGDFLTHAEREHLVAAGQVITFEQGIRFLTDYLLGDAYYRTTRPGQNLDRCRAQFKLVESLLQSEQELTRIVAVL